MAQGTVRKQLASVRTLADLIEKLGDKRGEYFKAGCRLVWLIDSKTETAEVYTFPTESTHVGKSGTLDGAEVLPGFSLALRKLFRKAPRKSRS